jgi:hypothetical protein
VLAAVCAAEILEEGPVGVRHEALLVRRYFGIGAAPQTHRIITALLCEAGAA